MPIACPSCKQPLNVGPQHAGKTIKCPNCSNAFKVPGQPSQTHGQGQTAAQPSGRPATQAVQSKVITVRCGACGATLKAPAAAAGKAVRCQCGQAVKVPGPSAPGTGPMAPAQATLPQMDFLSGGASPLFSLSESEWKVEEPKKPIFIEEEKPKKKINPYLENAAKEMGKGSKERTEGAIEYLNSSRAFLFGIGGFILAVSFVTYFLTRGYATVLANALGDEESASDAAETLFLVLNIYLGLSIFVSISFMVLGVLVRVIPLAASILATILYVLVELITTVLILLINPFILLSPRDLLIKVVKNVIIFGGLFQAINNANYYRYAKRLELEEQQQRVGMG